MLEQQVFTDAELQFFEEGATIPRRQVVMVLRALRENWNEVAEAEGKRLQDVYTSVGLFLVDLIVGLRLGEFEAMQVLGNDDYRQLEQLIGMIEPPEFSQ